VRTEVGKRVEKKMRKKEGGKRRRRRRRQRGAKKGGATGIGQDSRRELAPRNRKWLRDTDRQAELLALVRTCSPNPDIRGWGGTE